MKIIDIHTHLGDILYPRQNSLIWEQGVKKTPDWNDVYEKYNWPEWPRFHSVFGKLTHRLNILAGQKRNQIATLENLQQAMENNGVERCAVLSVYPYVPAEQVIEASQKDSRVIPFTGPDYSPDAADHTGRFCDEISKGTKGLKLHPILDKIPLDSPQTFEVVEAFAPHNRPVLFHSGYAFYFAKKEERANERPEFGEIAPTIPLIEAFPNVNFIAGHAGLGQVQEVIETLAKYPNVFIDTSFQPPHMIRALIDAFGPERILYGSDWPWGGMEVAKRCVEIACKDDNRLKEQIFYNNSVALIDG
ncbi:MAG: amidohydrolase family protein [Anaerolineae bacterium]